MSECRTVHFGVHRSERSDTEHTIYTWRILETTTKKTEEHDEQDTVITMTSHRLVCVCPTSEDAQKVAGALNRWFGSRVKIEDPQKKLDSTPQLELDAGQVAP